MSQTALMLIIAALCLTSAVLWLLDCELAAAFAFLFFGLGYVALAALFAP